MYIVPVAMWINIFKIDSSTDKHLKIKNRNKNSYLNLTRTNLNIRIILIMHFYTENYQRNVLRCLPEVDHLY